MFPWQDKAGSFSWFKAVVFAGVLVPGVWLAADYFLGNLGPRPITEIIHECGLWAIRILFLSMAVTPLRQILRWLNLISVRRMLGVAALIYALIHLTAYAADQAFDLGKVASEIVLRIYLTIGFGALALLVALGVTSTNGMIRRLGGRRWRRLHQATYVIGVLAVVHFFMQSKLDVTEAMVMAGLFLWLILYRILAATISTRGGPSLLWVGVLTLACALLTALGEAVYYYLKVGAKLARVLEADLSFDMGLRPAWTVLIICLAGCVLGIARLAKGRRAPANARRAS